MAGFEAAASANRKACENVEIEIVRGASLVVDGCILGMCFVCIAFALQILHDFQVVKSKRDVGRIIS